MLHVFSVQMLLQILVCFRRLLQRDGYKKNYFVCFIHCLLTGRLVYGLYRHAAVSTAYYCTCSTLSFTQFRSIRTSLDRLLCRVSTLLLLVTFDYWRHSLLSSFSNGFITHYRGTATKFFVSSLHLLVLLLLFLKGGRNSY